MKKISMEEQLAFAKEAQQIAEALDISLGEACQFVCMKNGLPITAKTLANTISLQRSLPQFDMELQFAQVDDEAEVASDPEYDNELALEELMKECNSLKKKLLAAENKNQVIMWAIDNAVKALPRHIVPSANGRIVRLGASKEIAMLDLSDVHLGKKMDPRDTAGICSYDQGTFQEQCLCLVEAIKQCTSIQRGGGVQIKKLVINSLGDLVDGEMIYGGQQAELFKRTMDQIFQLGDYFIRNVIVPLASEFEEIEINAVDGNHGRVGHKKEGFDRKLNFDGFLMRFWQQRLMNYADRIRFNISESPFMLYELLGKLHCLSHGASAGSARYPLAGMERFLTSVSLLNRNVIDYVHLAHFHRELKFNFNFSEILVNGSWIGPSEFSVYRMTAGDYPQQLYYGINPRHITWRYPIYLDKHINHMNNIDPSASNKVKVLTPVLPDFDPIELDSAPVSKNEVREDLRAALKKSFGQ